MSETGERSATLVAHPRWAEVGAVIDELERIDPGCRSIAETAADIETWHVLSCRMEALGARWIASFDDRDGASVMSGLRTTKAWLVHTLRMGKGAAGARVAAARSCFSRMRSLTLDGMAGAWSRGEVDARHVGVASTLDGMLWRDLASKADAAEVTDRRRDAESAILAAAAVTDGETLHHRLAHVRAQFAPEATAEGDARRWQARYFSVRPAMDTMSHVEGLLTAEAAALVDAVVQTYGTTQDETDVRTASQRRHDALAAALHVAVDAAAAASAAGAASDASSARLEVTVSLDTLSGAAELPGLLSTGALSRGGALDAPTARRLACDAEISRTLMQGATVVERGHRRAPTAGLRQEIIARQGHHCAWPGCQSAVKHIHHLKAWAAGGLTTRDNLCGLCWHHHQQVHHEGWSLEGDPSVGPLTAVHPRAGRWRGH